MRSDFNNIGNFTNKFKYGNINYIRSEVAEYGNLRIEFYSTAERMVGNRFLTLAQGLKKGYLTISEVDHSGSVPNLKCTNSSQFHFLVLAGEEIVGAKQDRITNISFVITPKSELIIPVSCVEQGRWNYKSNNFEKGNNAYSDLKRKLYSSVIASSVSGRGYTSNQSDIWADIDSKQRAFNKYSSTRAMGSMYDKNKFNKIYEYIDEKHNIEKATGMIAFINGSVASIEILPNPNFFNKIFPDLLQSMYQESLLYRNRDNTYSRFFSNKAFLNYLKYHTNNIKKDSISGYGNNYHIQSNMVNGDCLRLNNKIIHFYAFPRQGF